MLVDRSLIYLPDSPLLPFIKLSAGFLHMFVCHKELPHKFETVDNERHEYM